MDKFKKLVEAMALIEDDRKISHEVIVESLKEAMEKAYRKHVELPDIMVRVDINEKGVISVYQQYNVVSDVEDDELEMTLEEAKQLDKDAEIGSIVERKVNIDNFSRAAATLAKSVVKQKIREAEKSAIYDEYIDKKDEMVLGIVETVEKKFTLVNLGKTIAILPLSQQMKNEVLREGEKIRVVITDVNKETKKSQVTVSRSDALLVKRLFEKEVPEIYNGIVEIKAIARDPGERCKIAVISHDPNVDAIGACIGPRGTRVQEIISEIHGEKIDIFEWNDDLKYLVSNALSPAIVKAVILNDDGKSVLVVVNDDQQSLAIGKQGKNAKLAVKLIQKKIDIKKESDLTEEEYAKYQQALIDAANKKVVKAEEKIEEVVEEEPVVDQVEEVVENTNETVEEVNEPVVEETALPLEKVVEEVEDKAEVKAEAEKETQVVKKRKVKLEKKADEYVSKFEKLADTSKKTEKNDTKRKKKKDDSDRKLRAKDIISNLDIEYDNRPVYSEEELEEIRLNEEAEMDQYDVDYDEYEDYYNED